MNTATFDTLSAARSLEAAVVALEVRCSPYDASDYSYRNPSKPGSSKSSGAFTGRIYGPLVLRQGPDGYRAYRHPFGGP